MSAIKPAPFRRLGVCRKSGPHSVLRSLLAAVLAFFAGPLAAQAATTGQIAGSIVDVYTKLPVAHATIAVISPSDRYTTQTDERGSFTLAGVAVDTYTITITKDGYRTFALSGATVTQSETYRVDIKLDRQLKTIATVRAKSRSLTSAFQPDQTVDRVTVNAAGIEQLLGKTFNTNAKELLSELPSVTIDKNGTALIRGGTSFEGGFEFENIDYNEPNRSLSDRFQNLGSNYLLNGVGSIEIIPGGGDATHGNTGTGLISATAKRGTYPGFLNVDLEQTTMQVGGQRGLEWGTATQNQRLANYMSFTAEDFRYAYGPYGIDAAGIAADPTTQDPALSTLFAAADRRIYTTAVFNKATQDSRDFLDNLTYKFGHGNNQSLQFFVQSQVVHQNLDFGGYALLSAVPQEFFFTANPFVNPTGSTINSVSGLFGNGIFGPTLTSQAFTNRFVTPVHGAIPGQQLSAPETIDSPFGAYKLEYDNNLDASTILKLRYTRTDSNATESLPSQGLYIPQNGGIRRSASFDVTRALGGSKHTLQIGGLYAFTHPFGEQVNAIDYTGAYEGNYGLVGGGIINFGAQTHDILADFVQPQPVVFDANGSLVSGTQGCIGAVTASGAPANPAGFPQEHCGYLSKYFKNGPPPLPAEVEVPTANQQNYSLYAQDTFSPNSRLKVLAALRLDGYNFLIPDDPLNPPAVDGLRHQRLYEPHGGLAYRLGNHDALRLNFGRTLSIPLPTFIGNTIDRTAFAAFAGIPSYDSVTGKPATYCGPGKPTTILNNTYYLGSQPCANYADQLYWLIRNARYAGQSAITYPLQGSTFTNYDFSYSHEFPTGAALKLTPFYRRGYNIVETSQTLLGIDPATGTQQLTPPVQSNLGIQSATGLEFEATTPLKATGLTGTFTATYIDQIGNDPPGDYLPTSSVQLGNLYHSPTLAPFQSTLALTYRSRGGLRINPVFTLRSGYPYGAGVYEAFTVNGQPVYIPYSNALFLNGYSNVLSAGTVNPQNPGTITNPNLSATRGLESATSGPGSLRSHPTLNTDLTIEMTPPNGKYGVTYGLAITNLFDNVSSVPLANYTLDCQLVVTALCASSGSPSVVDKLHGPQQTVGPKTTPYIVYPNQTPLAVRIFLQVGL